MNYFNYAKSYSGYKAMRVYQEVQKLKGYAISIYNGAWEEALDMSFFHILDNYDEESGNDLSHYAIRVVGTILLGKYKHEIEHETSLETTLTKKAVSEDSSNPANIVVKEDEVSIDVQTCIRYLLPMFIQDYKFFKSKKPEDRKLTYNGLFSMFSYDAIVEAMNTMISLYGDDMEYLYDLKRNSHYRSFTDDRYKSSMDTAIEYTCTFKNIVIYKKLQNKATNRLFYVFNIEKTINNLIRQIYTEKGVRHLGDMSVYCTLSGNLVTSKEELRANLERELIGAVLSRFNFFRVACYEKGKSMVLTSSKKQNHSFFLNIFGEEVEVYISEVVSKCSNKGGL